MKDETIQNHFQSPEMTNSFTENALLKNIAAQQELEKYLEISSKAILSSKFIVIDK